jgi:SAM-dependent methyltransferase
MRPNRQQSDAWNGPESAHYVDHADRYDRQLAPVTEALLAAAAIEPAHAVLDVACGSGASALIAARQGRRVLGVDISEPLLAVAAQRAQLAGLDNVEFTVADVQTHDFGDGGFDVAISQFGLMFFDDPVRAFSNLRGSLARDGRIVFVTWQGLGANEWLAPVVAAVGRYADVPDLGGLANGGGMFALKDDAEITGLLAASGFDDIAVEPIAPTVTIGGGGSVEDSVDFLLGMGIVRGLLSRLDESQRRSAIDAVGDDLEQRHQAGVGVSLSTGVWLVSARVRSR